MKCLISYSIGRQNSSDRCHGMTVADSLISFLKFVGKEEKDKFGGIWNYVILCVIPLTEEEASEISEKGLCSSL